MTQQPQPTSINEANLKTLTDFMTEQFDPKLFVVRERYKFWSDLKRRAGETITQLAARIRQDARTCEFSSIENPQDDVMCTRFICSMQNEQFLKAVFKEKGGELTFAKAIQIAVEVEEATKVAKETANLNVGEAFAVKPYERRTTKKTTNNTVKTEKTTSNAQLCGRCGKSGHSGVSCRYKIVYVTIVKKWDILNMHVFQKNATHVSECKQLN